MIVLMAFLAAGDARHGNFMPTFLRDVIRLAAFSALANSVPCRFCRSIAAHCPPFGARSLVTPCTERCTPPRHKTVPVCEIEVIVHERGVFLLACQ